MMKGMLDALFWRLHTSYLLNDRDASSRFLAMIEDETKGNLSLLSSEIGVHIPRYMKIADEIKSNRFGSLHGGFSTSSSSSEIYSEPTVAEKDFHRTLMSKEALCSLYILLGIPTSAVVLHELDLGEYGRCDFVFRFNRKVVLIEVKMGEAPIYVSAQIEKYRIAEELDMCLGLYDEVKPYVMAESFGPYIVQKLSESGVEMIEHCGKSAGFRLTRGGTTCLSYRTCREGHLDVFPF